MTGEERRRAIVKIIAESRLPVSGASIASELGVSRQVIVQDIALLRAVERNILSTNKGYMAGDRNAIKAEMNLKLTGNTEDIKEQISIIKGAGGRIAEVRIAAASEEVLENITKELNNRGYRT